MDLHGQDQAYKRGLVLGLTMAEIIILILFCLLLALAAIFVSHRDRLARQDARIAELEAASPAQVDQETLRVVSILKEYWERHAPKLENPAEYFRQLVLRAEELAQLKSRMEELVEKTRDAEKQTVFANREVESLRERLKAAEEKLKAAEEKLKGVERKLKDAEEKVRQASQTQDAPGAAGIDPGTEEGRDKGGRGEHDWPPIIMLSEADNYHFNVGSAELSPSFRGVLTREVVPRILDIIRDYKVNVVEVIGHTDEQPIAPRSSNLDSGLRRVLEHGAPVSQLVPGDNAGLGLARAVSVAGVLASDYRLEAYVVLPLSAGQLIDGDRMSNWTRSGDVAARRRIEIRLRRSSERIGTDARAEGG